MRGVRTIVRSERGQSIIEAMVGLSILVTGLLGIFVLLSRSFYLSRFTGDQITGTYLAEEGVELTKNLIDHDVYAGIAASSSQWENCCAPGTYRIDYTGTQLTPYLSPQGSPQYLKFDSVSHRYGYAGSVTTPYNRWVIIATPSANEIAVNVIVQWNIGSFAPQSVNLEDHFYNWHP
jgi:hypothetical protein